MLARAWLMLLAASCASGIAHAATAEPEPESTSESAPAASATDAAVPDYKVDECCKLCPHAADSAVYDVSKYATDFRVLIDGRNGWLFRTVMDLTTTYPISDQGYLQLRRLSEALRARGTLLVIVYQPPRGLMDPEELQPEDRSHYDHALALRNYRQVLQNMRERSGVVVAPIDQLADEDKGYEYFFRRDHHWSPAGAEHTARLVADTLRAMPAFAGVPHQEFVTKRNGVISKPGTLQKIAAQACNAGYSLQYVPAFTTEQAGE
jgi:alginate biosynthesis protein AlgX